MTSEDPLPAPSRALWLTLGLSAIFPLVGIVAYFSTPPGDQGMALLIALVPAPVVLIYVLSLRSIRKLDARVRRDNPGALVFPIAQTADIQRAIITLPGGPASKIVQYVGVSIDAEGVMLWMNGRLAPVAILEWSDVTAVTVGGAPVDHAQGVQLVTQARRAGWENLGQVRVPAIQITATHHGQAVLLPLTIYSARTGYPASRSEFAVAATSVLRLKETGDRPPAPA